MLRQENSPISRTDTLRQSCRGYTAQDEKEFFQKSSHHRFLWWLLVVGYDLTDAPAELGAVVCPDSRTPVAVATGLRGQQVEQRVAVPGIGTLDARGCDPLVKQGAGPLHRHEHRVVALDPGAGVGPAAPFHVEAPVPGRQLFDPLSQPVRSIAWDHALPDP